MEKKLQEIIKEKIKDSQIFIRDINNDNNHFSIIVISNEFEGLSLIKQHKMVYTALDGIITKTIHAIQLKTLTPKEYEKK